MKRGKLTREYDIPFPASEVWQVYGSLELPYLIKTLPNFYKDLIVTGDGSAGTTFFDIWNLPGAPFEWYKEVVRHLDHEDMVKEVDVVEAGYLNFGYTFFRTRLEVHDKGPNQCTVRSIVMYELKDEFTDNEKIVTVDDMQVLAMAVKEYVEKKRAGGGSVLDGTTNNGPGLLQG